METRRTNYHIQSDYAKKIFLEFDQEKMIKKFSLKSDCEYIYIYFVGQMYRINRVNGDVEFTVDGCVYSEQAQFNEVLSIFDLLTYSKDNLTLSGEWTGIHNLNTTGIFGYDETGKSYEKYTRKMEDTGKLKEALEKLGGVQVPFGDIGYVISVFERVPIMIQFWEADDEFSAQIRFLWDKNILDYVRFETSFYIVHHLLDRIVEIIEQI